MLLRSHAFIDVLKRLENSRALCVRLIPTYRTSVACEVTIYSWAFERKRFLWGLPLPQRNLSTASSPPATQALAIL